ncbi:MAG TPA: rubredoxin [Clostridiales bacterium]|nr:rubredoxin [Clostridiales bacterium]
MKEHFDDLRELTAGELSALCSNLAKGCEKQYLKEEMQLFNQISDYYKSKIELTDEESFEPVSELLHNDLTQDFAKANIVSSEKEDRGALRALVWGEKVSRMLKSVLGRYAKSGNELLENTKIYVCDICGFVYIGDIPPAICPVCKVPSFKITEVGRR